LTITYRTSLNKYISIYNVVYILNYSKIQVDASIGYYYERIQPTQTEEVRDAQIH